MENMDKGLTVPKWVLIVRPKIPKMPPKFSAQFVCPSQKVWDCRKKRSLWVSVVRELSILADKPVVCTISRVSSPELPRVSWHPQILVYQLTLSKPGGADYAHHINTGIPGFSDLLTALYMFCYWLQ